ncbi:MULTISPECIES: hypothetical protein [Roseomonadaceae]|uniref:DUF4131 domain-containing protein n=1 Tax=Falsiroseomonas oleicola TaxID=2801474 RepID=A0ABS6HCZ7_9PROT|nr:hypothetical protein [Roseomonas oleicola]MBU8546607.1 hypothetical protein [Roseomonas oleicola]
MPRQKVEASTRQPGPGSPDTTVAGWPPPTPGAWLRGLLAGWVLLAATSAVMVLFLMLDWPFLGLLACAAFTLAGGARWLRHTLEGLLMFFLLAFAVVLFQFLLLETRMSPRALLDPTRMLVTTEGLHVQPIARAAVRRGRTVETHFQVAPVVPAGWAPGQPVPYWAFRASRRAAQAPWSAPLDRAVLAPAINIADGRDLARGMAAEWGSPVEGAPVMILWAPDAAALARQSRATFLKVLLLGMAAWPVLIAGNWAVLAWQRRARPSPPPG